MVGMGRADLNKKVSKETPDMKKIDINLFKGIDDEAERKILAELYSIVEQHEKIEWEQLPKALRFYLKSKGYYAETVDKNFIAKILHSLRKESIRKNSRKDFSEASDKLPIASEATSVFPTTVGKVGKLSDEIGAIGKAFTKLLYETNEEVYHKYNEVFKKQRTRYLAYVPLVFLVYGNTYMTEEEILHRVKELYEVAEKRPCTVLDKIKSTWFGEGENAKSLHEAYFEMQLAVLGSGIGKKVWVYRLDDNAYNDMRRLYKRTLELYFGEKKEEERVGKWELMKEKHPTGIGSREEIIKSFIDFFREYADAKGVRTYMKKIEDLLVKEIGKRSLEVDWGSVNAFNPELGVTILENPEEAVLGAEDALRIVLSEDFFAYDSAFHVRFYNLPRTLLPKQIGSEHINKLVQVEGIVSRVSEIKPFVVKAVYVCKDCGNEMIRLQRAYGKLKKPSRCEECGSKNIELDDDKSVFINFQHIRVQDAPERLRGGQMPRFVDAVLLDDLVDTVVPGDRVVMTGILRVITEASDGKPILRKVFDVVHIRHLSRDIEDIELTEHDIQQIKEEAKKPGIVQRIVNSIAPSIYGMNEVKRGIAMALFGGVPKELPDGTKIRGESHVLLIGDPGTAKSQILKYVANLAPRAIYTSGKGLSQAGLTAAAVKDEFTGSWVLEAGVLVLADKGFALIDEFDKMSDKDRASIHEAMEQRTVSVSKAGITATMNARTTVIAAANPKYGRYDRLKPVSEQIELTPTILSRFDLIFPIFDEPDEKKDEELADYILQRTRRDFKAYKEAYDPEFLKKYIAYARRYVVPVLDEKAKKLLKNYFVKLRKKSSKVAGFLKTPITARQLEALIRLTEAHARMRLSEIATEEDAKVAIEVLEYSYRQLLPDDEDMDINVLEVGWSAEELAKRKKIEEIIRKLQDLHIWGAYIDDIRAAASEEGMDKADVMEILERLMSAGIIYQPRKDFYKLNEERGE